MNGAPAVADHRSIPHHVPENPRGRTILPRSLLSAGATLRLIAENAD
jgi:hypothetical protein